MQESAMALSNEAKKARVKGWLWLIIQIYIESSWNGRFFPCGSWPDDRFLKFLSSTMNIIFLFSKKTGLVRKAVRV